jgi:hypothetical protein
MFVSFLRYTIPGYARRMSRRGSGGSMPSGITATVHNPVAQCKLAINLSVMK